MKHAAPCAGAHELRADDERGAVMVIGLFMALAVIAATWCVIGIGDALVFRDRSQEAADAAAFTNAVIHARGMNFIALINIVLMALCMVYLALSAFDFLLSVVLAVTGVKYEFRWCAARYVSWVADVTVQWCDVAGTVQDIENPLYKFDERYFTDFYKPAARAGFEAQVWVATAIPALGTLGSITTGVEHDRAAVSVSTSLLPGGGAPPPLNAHTRLLDAARQRWGKDWFRFLEDRRIALPVEAMPAWGFCTQAAPFIWALGMRGVRNWEATESMAVRVEQFLEHEPWSTIHNTLVTAAGDQIKTLFCLDEDRSYPKLQRLRQGFIEAVLIRETVDQIIKVGMGRWWVKDNTQRKFYLDGDDFWGQSERDRTPGRTPTVLFDGPKRVVPYAFNGNDWMQVWAISFSERPTDTAAPVVAVPSEVFPVAEAERSARPDRDGRPFFWAQAEFYLDCSDTWMGLWCNQADIGMYQMSWRARLRRVHSPDVIGSLFGMFFNNAIINELVSFPQGGLGPLRDGAIATGLEASVQQLIMKAGNTNLFTNPEDRSRDDMLH